MPHWNEQFTYTMGPQSQPQWQFELQRQPQMQNYPMQMQRGRGGGGIAHAAKKVLKVMIIVHTLGLAAPLFRH